jgi:hypothetical protein
VIRAVRARHSGSRADNNLLRIFAPSCPADIWSVRACADASEQAKARSG